MKYYGKKLCLKAYEIKDLSVFSSFLVDNEGNVEHNLRNAELIQKFYSTSSTKKFVFLKEQEIRAIYKAPRETQVRVHWQKPLLSKEATEVARGSYVIFNCAYL